MDRQTIYVSDSRMNRRQPFKYGVQIDPETGEEIRYGWRVPPQHVEENLRERRSKGFNVLLISLTTILTTVTAFIFIFINFFRGEFLYSFLCVLGLIVSLVMLGFSVFMTRFIFNDIKKIPQEPVHVPEKIRVIKNEAWRKTTNRAELESVKKTIAEYEDKANKLYEDVYKAVMDDLGGIDGYWDYNSVLKRIDRYNRFREEYERTIPDLKDRAERLYRGDISREIIEIESQIKQLQLERQQISEHLKEFEGEIAAVESKIKRKLLEVAQKEQKQRIRDIDREVLDCNRRIDALRASNKGDLYQEINVPVTVLQTPTKDIKDVRDKVSTFAGIPRTKKDQSSERKKIGSEIERLRDERRKALDAIAEDDEEERLRVANMYDDKINEKREELREYL